jgi:AcrR family transcriptional regulator
MGGVPRPARADAREALLEAARGEFARRGVAGGRVEDIARRAGISKGAFYLHFRTKEEAFDEIVQRLLGALDDHAARRLEIEDRIARDPVRDAAARGRAELAVDADLLEVLWRSRHVLPAVEGGAGRRHRDLVAAFRRRMRDLVSRRIADRRGAGELRPEVDPQVAGDVVVGAWEALARRMAEAKEKPDLAAWARSLHLVLDRGILAPAPRRGRRPRPR